MTIPLYRNFTVAICLGLLAACAPPPSTSTSGNRTAELHHLQASLDRQEQTILELSNQVAEMESRLQRQTEEMTQLHRAQLPQAGYSADQMPYAAGVTASIQQEGSPTEVYLQAFGDYASGRYQTAIHGFETFLQRFPNNSYASNAQFWLGDSYFNQQQYPLAIQEFERVLNNYPNAAKAPDALLKTAIAQLQLGSTDEARQAIDTLNQRYPKSTATQKAQELVIP